MGGAFPSKRARALIVKPVTLSGASPFFQNNRRGLSRSSSRVETGCPLMLIPGCAGTANSVSPLQIMTVS